MPPTARSPEVARYIDAVPPHIAAKYAEVTALIERCYPDAELILSYGVPTFRRATGRIGVGHWKGGVSLYPGPPAVALHKAECPEAQTSKGAVRLPLGTSLGPDIERLIRWAMEGA